MPLEPKVEKNYGDWPIRKGDSPEKLLVMLDFAVESIVLISKSDHNGCRCPVTDNEDLLLLCLTNTQGNKKP